MSSAVIRQFLESQGYHTISDDTVSHIDEWLEWYQNDVDNFHRYKIYNGESIIKEERYRLGMAKTVCEDWANLILNEKVSIHTDNSEKDEIIKRSFERNNFRVRANQLIEIAFALGTGAVVAYQTDGGLAEIDYIRADMIWPLSWSNGEITECAFGSERVLDGHKIIYMQLHRLGRPDDGEAANVYYIENHYLDKESGKELPMPETIEPLINTGWEAPFFFIVIPNIFNNIELESPLGISVFGNAIWAIRGADLVYDSYMNEFVLGRKRVMIGTRAVKKMMERDGIAQPVFDPKDRVFVEYTADIGRDDPTPIKELDMTIRAEEHEKGIQRSLDVLSMKCGMGSGRYHFENGAVKTATEVISSNSDLYRNLKKHELIVEKMIQGLIRAILYIETGSGEADVQIDFDDSIIEDSEKERTADRADVSMGAMPLWEYRQKYYGGTEQEAREAVQQPAEVIDDDIEILADNVSEKTKVEVQGKSLNGAQTQSLLAIMSQFSAGSLSEGQAVNLISTAIGIDKEEARKILNGEID